MKSAIEIGLPNLRVSSTQAKIGQQRIPLSELQAVVMGSAIKNRQIEDLNFKWKAKHVNIPTPRDSTHGRRHLGKQDITDIPTDVDVTKIMPLPWICPHCMNGHLMYALACNRCGYPSPLGEINWRQ